MSYLILTPEQADSVRGETSPGFALSPVELADGTFMLPDRVLSDPAHESKWAALAKFPTAQTVTPKAIPE